MRRLARTYHQLPIAATYSSALTALRSVGPLDGLHNYGDRRHNLEIASNLMISVSDNFEVMAPVTVITATPCQGEAPEVSLIQRANLSLSRLRKHPPDALLFLAYLIAKPLYIGM